ncbi:ribokinase [Brevibacterium aurantiacum]|uniref:Ribokinase n=1 Tax=Brevibacterium aurantiacum TaxID=273384 RepID=A0A2H1JWN9_BREAU|nr:ribokinase [Brevibacterium aurantiacum]GEB23992.1 ribokinase [Brevibacterium aurantiacum]SMX91879.1 ribokinase [Brevibacterium aurantiacum]
MTVDLDLTVVGSINADITAVTHRLPAAGETVGGGRLVHSPGGKGANQASAAARLGARTRMIGAVGSDAAGTAMTQALLSAGVGTDDIAVVDSETGTALIMVDAAGENQIAVCEGANAHVSIAECEFGAQETVLAQLEVSMDLITELSHTVPGRFVINAAPALPLPAEVVERADLIIVNESEYDLLPQLRDAKLVAITYGSRGSGLYEYGREVAFAEALPRRPVSTVGAGDAFCAALTIALAAGYSRQRSLAVANAVGAEAAMDPNAQPEFHRLEHYLQSTTTTETTT